MTLLVLLTLAAAAIVWWDGTRQGGGAIATILGTGLAIWLVVLLLALAAAGIHS